MTGPFDFLKGLFGGGSDTNVPDEGPADEDEAKFEEQLDKEAQADDD